VEQLHPAAGRIVSRNFAVKGDKLLNLSNKLHLFVDKLFYFRIIDFGLAFRIRGKEVKDGQSEDRPKCFRLSDADGPDWNDGRKSG
jgi:hypothetical protein